MLIDKIPIMNGLVLLFDLFIFILMKCLSNFRLQRHLKKSRRLSPELLIKMLKTKQILTKKRIFLRLLKKF